ncbi:MAG: hypothetical protein HQK55_10630, partial [Deltaproteobacteria bacterium]|nr:hypothetical protein [Deltaproteobacteria bacterium]
MALRSLIFFTIFCLLGACAEAPRNGQDPTPKQISVRETMTWLPMMDSREFRRDDQPVDVVDGVPVQMAIDPVVQQGRTTWQTIGFDRFLETYAGPFPVEAKFSWPDLPLRQMTTDMGLGLEVKKLLIKKIGP